MKSELFTIKPDLTQFYGRTVTKDMEFDERTDDGVIHQTLKDLVLTTEINREWDRCGIKNTLHSVQTEELSEGTVLIWNEEMGYIVPNLSMCKLRDLEEEVKLVKEIYADNEDMNPKEENIKDLG